MQPRSVFHAVSTKQLQLCSTSFSMFASMFKFHLYEATIITGPYTILLIIAYCLILKIKIQLTSIYPCARTLLLRLTLLIIQEKP
jgi:hypothetical protein